jgi:dienelactone hydrolase
MPSGCSWSRGGQPLACVPQSPEAERLVREQFMQRQPLAFVTANDASRADGAAVAAAFFPLERIAGPVLCLAGGDDQMWNASAHCDLAMTYLRKHGHGYADSAIAFPGAGHVFLIARSGPQSAVNSVRFDEYQLMFGGTPEADAAAASAAWPAIYAFLDAAWKKG